MSDSTVSYNYLWDNTAAGDYNSWDGGGGIFLTRSDALLVANQIISNTAQGSGGGLVLHQSDAMLYNNIIAGNRLYDPSLNVGTGAGIHVHRSAPNLFHTTLARNEGGDGSGLCIRDTTGDPSDVELTNTIIVSHTLGVTVSAASSVDLDGTLWNGNGTDWAGDGTVTTDDDQAGNPGFVDADADDYHITADSQALDAGKDAEVTSDVDAQPRPYGEPDLGADEYWPPGVLKHQHLPVVLRDSR